MLSMLFLYYVSCMHITLYVHVTTSHRDSVAMQYNYMLLW